MHTRAHNRPATGGACDLSSTTRHAGLSSTKINDSELPRTRLMVRALPKLATRIDHRQEVCMAKRKVKHHRVVMVISPNGQRRYWSIPVARFKSTKAMLARRGFRVVSR